MSRLDTLAKQAKAGCETSIHDLFLEMSVKIRSYSRKLASRGAGEADEIATDGISSLTKALATWNPDKPAAFATWAMKCAENAMFNRLRSLKRMHRELQLDRIQDSALVQEEEEDPLESIDDLEGLSELGDVALDAVRQMSESQQTMIFMVLDRRPLADIGETLGLTVEEVRSRLRTALNFIRFELHAVVKRSQRPI